MAGKAGPPLPSGDAEAGAPLATQETDVPAAESDSAEEETEATEAKPVAPTRPPPPKFKFSTFILFFLGALGFLMLIDVNTRTAVANAIGFLLNPVIGFNGQYILLTMFLAGAIEMAITAVGYNYTTDWVKAAKVASWSAAFRKVQMAALKSGKKDRIAAMQVHQQTLAKLSGEVSIAQLKGMAITWFLVIAIYSWVGIEIGSLPLSLQTVSLGGISVDLLTKIIGLIPLWFLLFSVYTVPMSLIFRRFLKNYKLRSIQRRQAQGGAAQSGPSGGTGTAL